VSFADGLGGRARSFRSALSDGAWGAIDTVACVSVSKAIESTVSETFSNKVSDEAVAD
jgi:hypothetical protein